GSETEEAVAFDPREAVCEGRRGLVPHRLGQVPLVVADRRQVVQGGGDGGVALAVQLLVEGEGPLVELARPGQVPLVAADRRQVVQGGGDGGVALAVQLLAEREGPLEELARPGQVPLVAADRRQE